MPDLCAADWSAHWRDLVSARQVTTGPRPGFWDRRAQQYAFSVGGWQGDPFTDFLEPWLRPDRTLLDVGAGTGRHVGVLAPRLDWVTAVEPSDGMRAHIPALDNVTVIGSAWEDADAAPADLVICSHVLYGVAEPAPFIERMCAAARERVFIYLRDREPDHPADALYAALTGSRRPRQPRFADLYGLLQWMGIRPDVTVFRYPTSHRYASIEAAAADLADTLGDLWSEDEGTGWLRANLVESDGAFVYDAGQMVSGVAHWKP